MSGRGLGIQMLTGSQRTSCIEWAEIIPREQKLQNFNSIIRCLIEIRNTCSISVTGVVVEMPHDLVLDVGVSSVCERELVG